MARSLSIRKRRMAKAASSPPTGRRQSDELSLFAIPYSSTMSSDPPFQLVPVKPSTSPSTLCANPPSPIRPISTTSSIYPDSSHSTIVPDSPHSSVLSPLPACALEDESEKPGEGGDGDGVGVGVGVGKRSSVYAVTKVWESIYNASTVTFVAEPENELPAYLGPHIISSEGDENQPTELFDVPSMTASRPSPQRAATDRTPAAAWPSGENSRYAEMQTTSRTLKKKSRFWGTLRLGRRRSIALPDNDAPSPPSEHTREARLGSNTDTVTTAGSVMTPDEAASGEISHGLPDRTGVVKGQDGGGILDAADGVHQHRDLGHIIEVDIPRDSGLGDEFWAAFPRCFI
ncbi:hypothetical protein E4U42_002114 [Claviceps africana]|uniref:Uncharacterized protein n=1 Tax=Claviceps africana TaxID=83212 RepID=A0A8K0NIV0_9HYPO|nr:hypothetical protein E4U42_002114 [Claviceps africana]